jgi:hypothetical protein
LSGWQNAYLAGALETLACSDKAFGQCAVDWYLKDNGPVELAAVVSKNPELPVPGILTILAKRHCSQLTRRVLSARRHQGPPPS